MRRRFFRGFKVRIPRKLKKAAKYGVKQYLHPAIIAKCMVHRTTLMYEDKTEFLIIGRRTKWKLKARSEIIKEHKRVVVEMWHKTNDRIISW